MSQRGSEIAYAFDLGDTLIEYAGLPLSWEAHYPAAIRALAAHWSVVPTDQQIDACAAELRRFNTRLHPRSHEISFAQIIASLQPHLPVPHHSDELGCATAFFGVFRQRMHCFSDVVPTLRALRARGHRVGVFTDVPYGMPDTLVREDVRTAGLTDLIDALLTSSGVGMRKPAAQTLSALASALEVPPSSLVHVGNERKDVDAALAIGSSAVLLSRTGTMPDWGQQRTIKLLSELLTG